MGKTTDAGLDQFIRDLFFDLQAIDGVKPLEIWNGFREAEDRLERTNLIKNLYKITLPLVNERCAGRPFEDHARRSYETVAGVLGQLSHEEAVSELFRRFPDPPTTSNEQKELYKFFKAATAEIAARGDSEPGADKREPGLDVAGFPDGLFDFRELRIVDNELPFIIFTDKEYRVIRGLALVYAWLIGLDALFVRTLADSGIDASIGEEFRQFSVRVHRDNPLLGQERNMGSQELVDYIRLQLQYQDYLDLFEKVYRWFELAREKYVGH